MEFLIFVDVLKRVLVKIINVIILYYGYVR